MVRWYSANQAFDTEAELEKDSTRNGKRTVKVLLMVLVDA
jgi:hypothetical protein